MRRKNKGKFVIQAELFETEEDIKALSKSIDRDILDQFEVQYRLTDLSYMTKIQSKPLG